MNYQQERLQMLFHDSTFTSEQDRYIQENINWMFSEVGDSPLPVIDAIDKHVPQVTRIPLPRIIMVPLPRIIRTPLPRIIRFLLPRIIRFLLPRQQVLPDIAMPNSCPLGGISERLH